MFFKLFFINYISPSWCILSDRPKENIERICRRKQKVEPFCPLTCGACIPLSPTPSVIPSSLKTSAPSAVCKDDDDFTFEYNGRDFTCEKLSSRKETNIERICRKKKKETVEPFCPLTCGVCSPLPTSK